MNAASVEVFAGEPGSVVDARRFVADAAAAAGLDPERVATVLVLVSELATNAVVHGASDFTVRVDSLGDGIRVTVGDLGPGDPAPQRPGPHELHGRGLQIVRQLADAWGVSRADTTRGKQVWVEMRARP